MGWIQNRNSFQNSQYVEKCTFTFKIDEFFVNEIKGNISNLNQISVFNNSAIYFICSILLIPSIISFHESIFRVANTYSATP